MKQPAGFNITTVDSWNDFLRWRRRCAILRNVRDFGLLFVFLGLSAFGSGILLWLAFSWLAGIIKL